MADSNADMFQSEGTEVAGNPAVVNFEDGLDAALSGDTLNVGIKAGGIATAKLADSAVTYAKQAVIGAATATADGLTTGLIADGETFVTVTSAAATNAVTLPAITSATIGQTIDLYVGANGYELLTPASSGNTINTVDSDGTNQLDVAANTLLKCTQVSATGWACFQVAATTITVVAPDND